MSYAPNKINKLKYVVMCSIVDIDLVQRSRYIAWTLTVKADVMIVLLNALGYADFQWLQTRDFE